MHLEGRLRRVVFGAARGSPANNPGGSPRCRRDSSTYRPSPKLVSYVNVKFFEFTRARARPATRRSPRTPPQSWCKGVWGASGTYGTAHATSRGQSTTPWARNVLAHLANGVSRYATEVPAAPGSLPCYAAFCRGQAHPRAVRNDPLRRESAAETTGWVPGPRNALLKKLHIVSFSVYYTQAY